MLVSAVNHKALICQNWALAHALGFCPHFLISSARSTLTPQPRNSHTGFLMNWVRNEFSCWLQFLTSCNKTLNCSPILRFRRPLSAWPILNRLCWNVGWVSSKPRYSEPRSGRTWIWELSVSSLCDPPFWQSLDALSAGISCKFFVLRRGGSTTGDRCQQQHIGWADSAATPSMRV